MTRNSLKFFIAVLLALPLSAQAYYSERFSLGLGIAQTQNPSQTNFLLGVEYEDRVDPFLGVGGGADYIFASPGVLLVALPTAFLHPIGTDFLVSASPLMEFGSSVGTHVGVRLGTRIPIPMGPISLIPQVSVDVISGGPDYGFGLGIEF